MKRFRFTSTLVLLLTAAALAADPVTPWTIVVQVPAETPPGLPLFLGSNINGWNPADPAWRLPPPVGGVSQATFSLPEGYALEFKVTRGSWDSVEKDAEGQEIANRTWTAGGGTLTVAVEAWRDLSAPRASRSTVTGRVVLVDGPQTPLGDRRVLRIRLPEGYDGSDTRYAVLYAFDGQNLFDAATSFAGEWKLDETLADLENAGTRPPVIVVGIDNAGSDRLKEYGPYADPVSMVPGGREFSDWLVGQLKPWVDARYRTLADPAHTALAGSSMGGLISVYTALRHPGVFGQVASFSGAFWFGNRALFRELGAGGFDPKTRVYLDVGTKELGADDQSRQMVRDSQDVALALTAKGVRVKVLVEEGAGHNEAAWARRFGPAYLWLTAAE